MHKKFALLIAGVLLTGCGGNAGDSFVQPTASTAETQTPTASPAAATAAPPTLTPVIGVTDPEGDATVPEADVISVEAYVDGDVLSVVMHLARLSVDPGQTPVIWLASVWHDGTGRNATPRFSIATRPAWPPKDALVSAYDLTSTATGQWLGSWSGVVSVDAAARTVRLTGKVPGLTEGAFVSAGTSLGSASQRADRVAQSAVTKRPIKVDGALASPPTTTETTDGLAETTAGGFPLVLVAPASWPRVTSALSRNIQATPRESPFGPPAIGAFVRPRGAGESPREFLDRLVQESGGQYVRLPDAGYTPPPGFEASVLVRTAESFEAKGGPSTLLQDWQSRTGVQTRFIAGISGDSIVIAFYESDGGALSVRYADLLGRIRITSR